MLLGYNLKGLDNIYISPAWKLHMAVYSLSILMYFMIHCLSNSSDGFSYLNLNHPYMSLGHSQQNNDICSWIIWTRSLLSPVLAHLCLHHLDKGDRILKSHLQNKFVYRPGQIKYIWRIIFDPMNNNNFINRISVEVNWILYLCYIKITHCIHRNNYTFIHCWDN